MSFHPALKLLSSYLDEEVTPAQLRLVERHLEDCSECRGTVAGLRAVAQGVRRLEAVAPPPTLAAAVERRVRRASLQDERGSRLKESLERWMAQPVLAPVFAIVLALGAILYLFAFGVARDASRGTRFIVAAVPSEESAGSDVATPGERRGVAALGTSSANEAAEPPPANAAEQPGPAQDSVIASSDSVNDSERQAEAVLERKLEATEQRLRSTAPARQSAASSGAGEAVPGPAPELQASALAFEQVEVREIAGRRFRLDGDLWIEIGLEGERDAEILDTRSELAELDIELEPFRDLGRVRLRLGDRVVELRTVDLEPRD